MKSLKKPLNTTAKVFVTNSSSPDNELAISYIKVNYRLNIKETLQQYGFRGSIRQAMNT
ncbi:hypothetical protein J2Z66_000789 [Paenibacillus eucommiae]|uniref:Transposase n=1 Tax=Paenibacillus eucommiae TaxID=1355755 RepID=A0ABS4INS4_9BACL|nr:hypothetical protein [Paenibacillus eucommiae]